MSKSIDLSNDILIQSFQDLKDDFAQLQYLTTSTILQLNKFKKDIQSAAKYIRKDSYNFIFKQLNSYISDYNLRATEIKNLSIRIDTYATFQQFQNLINKKDKLYDLLRTQQNLIGALITSSDWQSPSFMHSQQSQAGRQTGQIKGTINDYKRDQHLDEKYYQKLFLKEYIDAFIKLPINVLLTNCGMSAFATVLNFLTMENKMKGNVIIGKSIYFQNKTLISRIPHLHIIEVEEMMKDKIFSLIRKYKPAAIIFDSLCNSYDVAVPDLTEIIKYLVKNIKTDTYLVIDNTCLGSFFQPFKLIWGKTRKIHLVVFESLLKYHQFGLDRTNAGIIYAAGKDCRKLYNYRRDSGSNIEDSSVYSLPLPNRKMLTQRLNRLQRNTKVLASFLDDYISQHPTGLFDRVIYPLLVNHPSFSFMKEAPFAGSFFVIQFKPKYQKIKIYQRFLNNVINQAKKLHIEMAVGTSFGFNKTRIYLTALRSEEKSFIRISLGTETVWELENLKTVFKNALETFR